MGLQRKIKRSRKTEHKKLFTLCSNCCGSGYTTSMEYIDRSKYKGLPQEVRHACNLCDNGYVPYVK